MDGAAPAHVHSMHGGQVSRSAQRVFSSKRIYSYEKQISMRAFEPFLFSSDVGVFMPASGTLGLGDVNSNFSGGIISIEHGRAHAGAVPGLKHGPGIDVGWSRISGFGNYSGVKQL